jgi:hypothetical protein
VPAPAPAIASNEDEKPRGFACKDLTKFLDKTPLNPQKVFGSGQP